jgi:hypothetical protein
MLEKFVERFGEEYRSLIEDALEWLDSRESLWDLDQPFNRLKFIEDLVSRTKPKGEEL